MLKQSIPNTQSFSDNDIVYWSLYFLKELEYVQIRKIKVFIFEFVVKKDTSFGPIGMKLGMDTPWDPGSDLG